MSSSNTESKPKSKPKSKAKPTRKTVVNLPHSGQFQKGGDARINKKGRPKSFDALRMLARSIADEEFIPITPAELKWQELTKERITVVQAILRRWANSRAFQTEAQFLEIAYGKVPNVIEEKREPPVGANLMLPAELLAPSFVDVWRKVQQKTHLEYILYGGRGSTKSTFTSLALICLLVNNPQIHILAMRQVASTLRDSVYSQFQWAITELGVYDKFKFTLNPLEIVYLPTNQRIYFRGADDPAKIKSLKPPTGYLGALWFEELDQFHGQEAIRKIEQSAIRGGELAWIFKTFNPPKTRGNWANKYIQIPKETQLLHKSNYILVPTDWLGQTFIDEAEHLKKVHPAAYNHEYLGEVTGAGGQVFDNVVLRTISDKEIHQFDRVYHGIDWGYFPDPFAYIRVYFNAAKLKLYIYDEYKAHKKGNRAVYNELIKEKKITKSDLLIADSSEPKSISDFKEYGATIRGAEKGADSVAYSIKWMQSLAEIVIDNVRCPNAAEEFTNYELEQDRNGEYISSYPDKDNHFIDAARYATNLIWRRRGQ